MQEEFYKAIQNLPKPHIRRSKLISSISSFLLRYQYISIRKYIDNVTKTITSNQFIIDKNNAIIESNILLKAQNEIPKKDAKNLSKLLNIIHIDAKNSLLDMIYDKHNSDLSKKNDELLALIIVVISSVRCSSSFFFDKSELCLS
jgi:hypothetical protein